MLDSIPKLGSLLMPGIERLHSLDIEPELILDSGVNDDKLDAFNDEFGIVLPSDVRDLYSETDGFMISWESGDDWGQLDFPSLYELRLHRQRWINGNMPDSEWTLHLEDHVASQVLFEMRVWVPFDESGGGDLMCFDCDSGRVVEYDHEWGNLTRRNGTVYATSVTEYIQNCSRICFQSVWLAHFKQAVRDSRCFVDWSTGDFHPKYWVTT